MKKISFYGFLKNCLWGVSLFAVFALFFLNFVYNASVSYDGREKVSFENHIIPSIVMLFILATLPLLFIVGKDLMKKINRKHLFWILSLIYTVMAVYLIVNVDSAIRADAGTVFSIAKNISKGDYSAFLSSGYIERYPHQTGLLFYDGLLQIFTKSPVISFLANFAFVIGINYLTVKTTHLLFKRDDVTVVSTFVVFAFLPQFFFILFAYGLTPGFFFMTLSFYNAIKFAYEKKISNAVFTGIGMGMATFFKQNFLIGGIAIAIFFFLQIFKEKKKEKLKMLIALICVTVFMFVPSTLVKSYYQLKTDIKLEQGAPSILWVAMGTDIDNNYRAPGWYTGFNYYTYTNSGYNTEKSSEIGKEQLKLNIEKIKENPKEAFIFFYDKTISQWCEPMFQSVWSGPLEDCGQYTHTELLKSIYTGGLAETVIATFSKLVVLAIFGFSAAFLFFEKKHNGWEIALMFLIGGLLFHTVWEGKSQYTYPYVFTLIPFACYGIKCVADKLDAVERKKNNGNKGKN